jgi:hypothetical protein
MLLTAHWICRSSRPSSLTRIWRRGAALIAYVTVWGAGVDTYSPRIRDALSQLGRIVNDDDWRAMAPSGIDATAASGYTDRATGTQAVRYASADFPPGPPTARRPTSAPSGRPPKQYR